MIDTIEDNYCIINEQSDKITDCLCDLDDNNIEETITDIEDIIKFYNIDDINEDKLKEYAHRFINKLVSDE